MKRRSQESGFALLLVFAMAAAVAVLLYIELPRAAFEAQRAREQLLIDRGEQYQRAIQLFFRKYRRFPAGLEQLENTNNYRFLRRRYKDPLTGKDEWRLIHIGPGGMLTDSRTQTPPGSKQGEKGGTAETEGARASTGQELPSAAVRRRASEMGLPTPAAASPEAPTETAEQVPAGQEVQQAAQPAAEQAALNPQPQPGQSFPQFSTPAPAPSPEPEVGVPYVVPAPQTAQPGQPPAYQPPVMGAIQPGSPAQPGKQAAYQFPVVSPGQPYQPQQPAQTGAYPPGQVPQPSPPIQIYTGQPGQANVVQIVPSLVTPYGRPGGFVPAVPQQRLSASPQTGATPAPPSYALEQGGTQPAATAPSNPALEMIRKLLTTPRPGGLGQTPASEPIGYGTGIAGVASKAEGDSILTYNDRTRYDEWEFIYDLRKDRTMLGPVGPTGSPPGMLFQQPGSPSPVMPMPTPRGPSRRGR